MKKSIIFMLIALFFVASSCSSEEEKLEQKKMKYFLDEDFKITEKSETVNNTDGHIFMVRQWKLQREIQENPDSVWIGVILSDTRSESCNCGATDFVITDELWFNRNVGDKVHFDYIRKNRFFKVHIRNIKNVENIIDLASTPEFIQKPETNPVSIDVSNMTKLQIEMKILELEREIMYLKSKL